ncbi:MULTISPECIES: metal ABC transporter substrate-binding protein [Microbispora]|uniref:Metal ABC transporter substrate-binding protein n=1 Tax=Microbispora siamensis TaxID=564413 RepID=A0ABQ4GMG3_9ACTN|nr:MULTISPECIES: metal ABC transporter substrate-binding protein [Microbispora]OPG13526.1 zinc ABC transporter substrate-binding protein [Microbispora sp. GKU 823]GIH62621.1 metal ABC transporter substrate-binding protein [Microbispora siamensis]
MLSPLARTLSSAALLVLLAAGCGGADKPTSSSDPARPLKVVATTTQVADFARNVGGDRVSVHQLLKPNVDPHDYEPSPADMQAIAEADVLVKNGVGLEKWLDETISAAGFDGPVVDASQGVRIRNGDPHIWHNPLNVKTMVATIEKGFAAADPDDAAAYQANRAAYDAKLGALDTEIAKKIESVPADRRKLVTNHDAFGYYLDRYKLTFVGSIIPSFDTSAELSAKQVSDLVAKIKATGVAAIFSEASLPPKTAEAIGREAGVTVVAGEDALYGDSLGPEGSAGATYLQMEEHNTDTIVNALRGTAA